MRVCRCMCVCVWVYACTSVCVSDDVGVCVGVHICECVMCFFLCCCCNACVCVRVSLCVRRDGVEGERRRGGGVGGKDSIYTLAFSLTRAYSITLQNISVMATNDIYIYICVYMYFLHNYIHFYVINRL